MKSSELQVRGATLAGAPIVTISITQGDVDDNNDLPIGEQTTVRHPFHTKGEINEVIRGLVAARAALPGVRPAPVPPTEDGEAE